MFISGCLYSVWWCSCILMAIYDVVASGVVVMVCRGHSIVATSPMATWPMDWGYEIS